MLVWSHPSSIAALSQHYQSYEHNPYLQVSPSNLPPSPSPSSSSPPHTSPMSTARPHAANPTVRIHHSTPSPAPQSSLSEQPMLTQSAFVSSGWGREPYPHQTAYLHTSSRDSGRSFHKRKSSGSSITSGGPPSPLTNTTTYPQIAGSDLAQFDQSFDFDYVPTPLTAHTSKSLPTPTATPTSASFMPAGYQNVGAHDATAYSAAMRRGQSSGQEEDVTFALSGPQSVSTMSHQNSPATPHTSYDVDFDETTKSLYPGENLSMDQLMEEYLHLAPGYPTTTAAYNPAIQDVFQDQMYSTTASYPTQQQHAMQRFGSHMSAHRSAMFANRIQAANQDHLRTNSPITSVPRDQSPFKQDSQYLDQSRMHSQRSSQQMNSIPVSRAPEPTKSVSPKELMLDDPDVDDVQPTSLFPGQSHSVFSHRRTSQNMNNFQQQSMYPGQYAQTPSVQVPQQYPFIRQNRQGSSQQSSSMSTPDFPAHIASMESTIEEGMSEPSTNNQLQVPMQRPDDTSSDAGTYTCTYHGCTKRFETPALLQKHKREGHRQVSPASASTAQSVALRNTQAGPHKCERINPSTGKPCNSIFSRPYDLTRHEDTIHNARKQKVRCHLCTEEKTFSRNDALTRHMRVVHPDVDWPGKTRRKNGRD